MKVKCVLVRKMQVKKHFSNILFVFYYKCVNWYFGAWNMGAKYISDSYSSNYNAVNGIWTKSLKSYCVSMGWGNSSWNVSAQVTNPFTWSWRDSQNKMTSKYFDRNQTVYGAGSHCYIRLGVTYTFGFGKKIKQRDEVSRQNGANSAILK